MRNSPAMIPLPSPILMGDSADSSGDAEREGSTLLLTRPKAKAKRPPFYKVILLNDDYTPMDFVVNGLESIFRKSHAESVEIMLLVHTKGKAIVARYTRDVAETKIDQVIEYALSNDYPLQCVMEIE